MCTFSVTPEVQALKAVCVRNVVYSCLLPVVSSIQCDDRLYPTFARPSGVAVWGTGVDWHLLQGGPHFP